MPEWLVFIKKYVEDTKGAIRIRNSKDRQHNGQKKTDKQRSTKHKHKSKDEPTKNSVPAPLVASVVLI